MADPIGIMGIGKINNLRCPHGLIEHWDGTSWSIITTSGVSGLRRVTAISDGTVVIVSSSGAILEN